MASSTGSKISLLIVGGASMAALTLSTIASIRGNTTAANLQRATILTGNQYFIPSTATETPYTFVGQNSVLRYNYPTKGDVTFMSGSISFDRYRNSLAELRVGTGTFLAHATSVCTNSGSLSKYRSCYIANPFTGTASILGISVHTNKAPNASPITCVTTPIGNVYGTASTLIRYFSTFSGSSIYTMSGTLTGQQTNQTSPRILPGAGVRCWHSTQPGVGLKERLELDLAEQYIP